MVGASQSSLEQDTWEGESPVHGQASALCVGELKESGCLGLQPKVGGILHLRLEQWQETDSKQVL